MPARRDDWSGIASIPCALRSFGDSVASFRPSPPSPKWERPRGRVHHRGREIGPSSSVLLAALGAREGVSPNREISSCLSRVELHEQLEEAQTPTTLMTLEELNTWLLELYGGAAVAGPGWSDGLRAATGGGRHSRRGVRPPDYVLQHTANAARLAGVVNDACRLDACLRQVFDLCPTPSLVVDDAGAVVMANGAAFRWLSAQSCMTLEGGALCLTAAAAHLSLMNTLAMLETLPDIGRVLRIARTRDTPPVYLRVCASQQRSPSGRTCASSACSIRRFARAHRLLS